MHTMNLTEYERIEVKKACDDHIEVMMDYCKPLSVEQIHVVRILKAFVKKLENLPSREIRCQ